MRADDVAYLRRLMAEGLSDDEIVAVTEEAELEALQAEHEDRMRYGVDDPDDGLTDGQRAYNDRLDMGRNDAGEWLGFM